MSSCYSGPNTHAASRRVLLHLQHAVLVILDELLLVQRATSTSSRAERLILWRVADYRSHRSLSLPQGDTQSMYNAT